MFVTELKPMSFELISYKYIAYCIHVTAAQRDLRNAQHASTSVKLSILDSFEGVKTDLGL